MEDSALPRLPSYRAVRRKLLDKNPYFQRDLVEMRRKLGIPEMGFSIATEELVKEIPCDPSGLRLGEPDLVALEERALLLGFPLRERLEEWRGSHLRQGRDFDRAIKQLGWWVLPIFSALDWAAWWVDRERKMAGLNAHEVEPSAERAASSAQFSDERSRFHRAILHLVRRYRLGEAFAPTMSSTVLGVPPGGGEADVMIKPRRDGAGIRVTLNCVDYDCTLAHWAKLFRDCIQPALLSDTGRLPRGLPSSEALAQARRKAKPGRPPYSQEVMDKHMRMWTFCAQEGFLAECKTPLPTVVDAFLDSLDERERYQFENLDPETFWRAVTKVDKLMRPTGSEPDF